MCHGQGHAVIIHKEILNNTIYKENLENTIHMEIFMCFSRDIKSSNWSEWKIGAVRFTFIDKKMSHGISLQLLGVKLLMQEADMQEEEITQHGVF
jgi:hypothetical protein